MLSYIPARVLRCCCYGKFQREDEASLPPGIGSRRHGHGRDEAAFVGPVALKHASQGRGRNRTPDKAVDPRRRPLLPRGHVLLGSVREVTEGGPQLLGLHAEVWRTQKQHSLEASVVGRR